MVVEPQTQGAATGQGVRRDDGARVVFYTVDAIGVSRQAVSKWENGTSDPNTSNLIALAKLYGISAEELLKNVEHSAGTAKPNESSEKTA